MEIQTIGVCGAGTMGRGIALTAALAGFPTILYDLQLAALEKAQRQNQHDLQKLVDKGRITADQRKKTEAEISYTNQSSQLKADFFIEAIIEQPGPKIALLNQLAELNTKDCILATNTSSLSVGAIAEQILYPERVIGLHFFNPATLMKLVELVTTPFTSPAILERTQQLVEKLGKTWVLCQDAPGFIVNRVARPFYLESLRMAEKELASFEQIDRVLESAGFKMGPFRLMDLIGNDINYAVSCSVYDQLGKPTRLLPSFIQQQLVQAGKWGQKSGEGYYIYRT